MRRGSRGGWTAIEIVVALGVLALLTVAIAWGAHAARRSSVRHLASSEVETIQLALQSYRSDHGRWPDAKTWVRDIAPYFPLKQERIQR